MSGRKTANRAQFDVYGKHGDTACSMSSSIGVKESTMSTIIRCPPKVTVLSSVDIVATEAHDSSFVLFPTSKIVRVTSISETDSVGVNATTNFSRSDPAHCTGSRACSALTVHIYRSLSDEKVQAERREGTTLTVTDPPRCSFAQSQLMPPDATASEDS